MFDLRSAIVFRRVMFMLLCAMPVVAADYAGASACVTCHPSHSQRQSITAHARALAKATPTQPGEWAFGAGTQAVTFVRRLDADSYLEEARSWYRESNGY